MAWRDNEIQFLERLLGRDPTPRLLASYPSLADYLAGVSALSIDKAPPSVSLTISPASVTEDGAPNLVYTFTRTDSTARSLTVFYTVGGTATNGADYVGVPTKGTTKSIVIPAGSATAQVIVNPTADTAGEADETVLLTLFPSAAYVVATPDAVSGVITNDDPIKTVDVAVSSSSVLEDGATNLVYTFTRTGSLATSLTVNYSVGGTALLGTDYVGPPTKGTTKTIVFAAGASSAQVTVDPVADATLESNETVILTLLSGTGYMLGANKVATGTITNDETVIDVSLSVSASSLVEDGADVLTYTFTRSGSTTSALNVNYLVSGTATIGVDYTGVPTSGTTKVVTIPAGGSSVNVVVDPVADTVIEANETVAFTLAPGAGYLPQTAGAVSATLTDDDTASVSVALQATELAEDGSQDLVYLFTRAGSLTTALTVNYTLGGTATSGADYRAPTTTTVTFAAGSATAVLQIDPLTDFALESDETVTLTLASGAGYVASTGALSATIMDDDAGDVFALQSRPGANLTIYLDFDGANLSSTAWGGSVSNAPAFDLDSNTAAFSNAEKAFIREVFYRVAADFAPFNVNVTTKWLGQDTITRASLSDGVYGTVCLFSAIGNSIAPSAGGIAYLNIFDDTTDYYKPALVFPEKLGSAKNVAEAASHEIGHNLGLSHDGTSSVGYYTGQGSAPGWAPIMGVGYYEPLVQWSKGQYSSANNLQDDIAIIASMGPTLAVDDYSNASTFALSASASNPIELVGTGRISGNSASGNDVDQLYFDVTKAGLVTVSVRNALVFSENGVARAVELPQGVGNLRFDCDVYNASNTLVYNYAPSSALDAEFSFNATAAGRYYLRIDGVGSTTDLEPDYGSLGDYVVSVAGAGVLVNTTPAISLSAAPSSVSEDGASNIAFTFARTGFTSSSLTVNYVLSGTATAGVDYTGVAGSGSARTVTFAAGSSTATITVDPTADTSVESDETVVMTLASGTGYTVATSADVSATIANDETQPEVTLAVLPSSVSEDGASNLVFTFTRSGSTTGDLTVNYTVGGSATLGTDYTGISASGVTKSVTILSGSSTAAVVVDPTSDATVESNETVALTLASGTGYAVGTASAVAGEIVDDDGSPTVSLSVSAASALEDEAGRLVYTFARTGSTTNALTVNYTVSGGATLGTDYLGISAVGATKSVTIAAGATSAQVLVEPVTDMSVEADETVVLTLASGTGYALGASASATSTILNDDGANAFTLQSLPGANLTLYLDFDGASLAGTAWASKWTGGATPNAPAFSLDADGTTFSQAEQAVIREVFYRVAADFAPFNINVTTQWLGQDTITRSSSSDSSYGTVCVISAIGDIVAPTAGGIAYVNIFDMTSDYYKPALVFPEKLSYGAKSISEAVSHEVGHNLGLSHDGTASVGYYTGQGSSPGWAPIMGVGYSKPLVQWSKGEYPGANNAENDVTIIASKGPILLADDYANATRYALTTAASNPSELVGYGRISATSYTAAGNDVDLFYFDVTKAGAATISARNAVFFADNGQTRKVDLPIGFGDLRIDCDLYDATTGALVYDWSPEASLDAEFTFTFLSTGRYFLRIDGVGSASDGETDYGAMGAFAVSVLGGSAGLSAGIGAPGDMAIPAAPLLADCFDAIIDADVRAMPFVPPVTDCYWFT
jgi:hypothetical protein